MQAAKNTLVKILRASERYTHLDMVYVARGGFWAIFGQVTTTVLSLALVVVFANYLPKETYGLYRYILSLAGLLGIFTLTEMNQAVSQAVAAGNDGAFRASVRYQLKWNVLQFLAFCALSAYYFYNGTMPIALSFLIMSVTAPLVQAFNTYGAYLTGKRQFGVNSVFGILSTATYVISMIAVILLSGDIVWLVAIYSFITLLTNVVFYSLTLRAFKPPATEGSESAIPYGRQLTFIGLMGPVVSQIDKIILTHFWGAAQLAEYTLALAVPERATPLIKGWVGIGLPKFAAKTPEEINKVFYLRIFQGMLVGAACAGAYVLAAPYLFMYLLPKYLDVLPYSQLLAIGFIFAMPNRYVSLLLTSQKLARLIFINSLVLNFVRIILYVALGVFGGILGLIFAQILNTFIGMFVNIFLWRYKS